jgi:hypothetical protein
VTIDAYLLTLRRLLPRYARLRVLPETREHLRDAAARHRAAGASQADAEVAATADFGEVEAVAHRLRSELAVHETRLAAALAIAAVAFFVFPLYVVPENSLPPAQWNEIPSDIYALQVVSIALWILAGALAALSAALAWTREPRFAALTLVSVALVLSGAVAVTTALAARWIAVTPSTPNWALAVPLAVGCLGVCVAATWWALSSRPRLVPHD